MSGMSSFTIAGPSGDVPATLYEASQPRHTLILAHGAGAGQTHPWMRARANDLAERGVRVVTFDFPYITAGRRVPDRP
jgi:predicted alpha/beta-hydrolase family hydrolase